MNMGVGKLILFVIMLMIPADAAGDTNPVFSPCSDTKVERNDGFTFGLAFSTKDSYFFNQTQLSPCDKRLSLSTNSAQLAVFRPKVDEISLLTINSTTIQSSKAGGYYMVAFAGRQYAARSLPVLVADNTHTITSFTLVLEFQKGILQNLFWKKFGCASCPKDFVCLNNTDCAIPNAKCKGNGGTIPCDVGVQLAFSGTGKNERVFNSWYEVANLRQYSLFGLYSDIRDSLTSTFDGLF